ncbi:MAG: sigma factor-like helix-turn-helix DNA-binding protein [Anaerohalosphaeraceae bacterium]
MDPESLRRVLEASQKVEKSSDQRMKALEGCLEKLTERKRCLLQYRYQEGLSCSAVADKMQLPLATVYRTMARIHKVLQDCIHRTLILWETES